MSTIIWGLIALLVLFVLSLFATRSGITGRNNIIDLGDELPAILLGLAIAFVASPFVLAWFGIRKAWKWYNPDPPLPIDFNDPVWNRETNGKIAEEAFRALQHARMKRDPLLARGYVKDWIYRDLVSECDELRARKEINTRQDVQVIETTVYDEKIDDFESAGGEHRYDYSFSAKLRGTMVNVLISEDEGLTTAGSAEPQDFLEDMEFNRTPEASDKWRIGYTSGLPISKERLEFIKSHIKGAAKLDRQYPLRQAAKPK